MLRAVFLLLICCRWFAVRCS